MMKRNQVYLFLTGLLLLPSLLYSQEEEHPIDRTLTECLEIDSNQSTFGMIDCFRGAQEGWDGEMNRLYKELMGRLDSAGQSQLRQAQRAWLAYRDAEFGLSGEVYYGNLDGTMYHIFAAERETNIVRQRSLELRDYLNALTDFDFDEDDEE